MLKLVLFKTTLILGGNKMDHLKDKSVFATTLAKAWDNIQFFKQDLNFLKADLYWLPRILLELLVLAVLLFLLVTNAHAQELNSKEHYFLVQKFPTQDSETSLYVLPLEITQPRISDCLYPKKITYGKDPVYQLSCQNGDVYVVMSVGLRVAKNLFPEFFLERGKIPPFKLEKVRPIKNA